MENFKIILLINAMAMAACTPPIERDYIVDGPRNAMFGVDLKSCKHLAETTQQGVGAAGAVIGATSGAIFGALDEDSDSETVLAGAGIGAVAGAAAAQDASQTEQRNIVIRCLQNRGHAVVG
ncbi:glycine zipper family protein [Pelagimonas varians]|uniref:Glycine zipper domain-containing protein n=1 Tax=Pelagimonas varians TaxID=696760 RepID=A0A238JT43_9RHOB|nr:glycine zipper family protein [Pelagimonas varians]PYG34537.1 hypothetical protein C8N36_101188 [Pelagimonas varians]SMX33643.1 hypothetical protein PEV8663_00278 [Pelagimonas varians]